MNWEVLMERIPLEAVTIVTGGGRGIGRSIALRMGKETAVILVGRTETDLASTASEIEAGGGWASYHVGDVADPRTAEATVSMARELNLPVRHLICNAGIGKGGETHTFDRNVWKRLFDVNVHGSFFFTQAVIPHMVDARSGTICYISSTAGLHGSKRNAAYAASKAALNNLAESVALEYGKFGITSVALCPGFVDSEMTDRVVSGLMGHRGIDENEARAVIGRTTAQRRIFAPSEVAETVAYVCSGKARSISGAPLVLSGGEV